MPVPATALAMVLAATCPASAQETRIALPGHLPPLAELAQMDWLVAQWEDDGINGNRAMESWLSYMDSTAPLLPEPEPSF